MKQAKINVQISALVLRDFPYAQRYHIAAALEQELTRLLSEERQNASAFESMYIPQIRLGPLAPGAGVEPAGVGSQIAQRVYQEISGNARK